MATTDRYRRATKLQLEKRGQAGRAKAVAAAAGVAKAAGALRGSVATGVRRVSAEGTPAQRRARSVKLGDLKPTHQTTAGKRRLSFEQAYLRRTTDSSRARVEARYGQTASSGLKAKAGVADRSLPKPVPPKPGGYADKPSRLVPLPRRGMPGPSARSRPMTDPYGPPAPRRRRRRRRPRNQATGSGVY